jgi:hypothetical protein
MNILVSPLPRAVPVGGTSVPLKTGYRTGIQVVRVAESTLSDALKAGAILRLYFGDRVPEDTAAALEAAMDFHRLGEEPPRRRSRRLLDWDHDAGMILADFRREYGIDLADEGTQMHWWVFMAYFANLSNDSETKTAMYYRNTPRPRDLAGADAKRFGALKKAYALPPRDAAVAAAKDAERWGDA